MLTTAFILIYLAVEFLTFRGLSPADITDAVEAVGAGGFAAIGLAAVCMGLPYLYNFLPLGEIPGAVPVHTPAVDPVVQALALTDVVAEAAVTALLLAIAIQAHKRFGTLDPHDLAEFKG